MYLSLKKYEVSQEMIDGALAMANWYRENGDSDKAWWIENTIRQVEDDTRMAIGQVWGKLKAYKNRFEKLATSHEVAA